MKILLKNQQRRRLINRTKISKAAAYILSLLEQSRLSMAELSILFVGDRKMKQLNFDFRGVRKSTDVLSFESGIPVRGDGQNPVLGDIVICIPKAESQARAAGTGLDEELNRLLIHGILHLAGYDHEASDYRARIMRKKEKDILNALKKMV